METSMDKEFADKIVLVTGATSGIGKATALRFAEAGASIAAVARDQAKLLELQREIETQSGQALTIQADLSLEEEPAKAVSKTIERFGGIDVLVNAAGHISSGTIENTFLSGRSCWATRVLRWRLRPSSTT